MPEVRMYAKYTQTLHDCLIDNPNLLDNLVMPSEGFTERFIETFKSMYFNYEINGETVNDFKLLLENTFTQWKYYYNEMLMAYETKINMLDGTVIDEETRNVDLPNRVTANEYDSDKQYRTTKGGDVIDLKRRYMNLIRDVYKEFCNKFDTCFIQIYD